MSHDDEPTSNALRGLRRAYGHQRYDGDLGAIVEPARQRSFWPILAAAAGLAVCALIAWQVATQLPPTQPIAGQGDRPSTQPGVGLAPDRPQVHTLELTEPSESIATEGFSQRRPVLPGLLVMHSPRATPPQRPSFAPRPALSFIQSTMTSENEQGSLP